MAGKPGWWNANEQVSGEQAWKPVHKLGDFSVGRGNNSGGGGLAYGLGALAGAAIGKKIGGRAANKTPVAPAKQIAPGTGGGAIGNTAVLTPEFQAAMTPRNEAFDAGRNAHLTNVRSESSYGTDVDTWAGGRYQGFDAGLNAGVTPTPARLQPFRSGIGEGGVQDAEVVPTAQLAAMPLALNPAMKALGTGPLQLNAGPQPAAKQRRKPGIQPMGKARIDRDLAQYKA